MWSELRRLAGGIAISTGAMAVSNGHASAPSIRMLRQAHRVQRQWPAAQAGIIAGTGPKPEKLSRLVDRFQPRSPIIPALDGYESVAFGSSLILKPPCPPPSTTSSTSRC